MMKRVLIGCLAAFLAGAAFAGKPDRGITRELTYAGLPNITYATNADGQVTVVSSAGKQIISYDWSASPYRVPVRFFDQWVVTTSVLPDGSAAQDVVDSHGARRSFSAILANGRQHARQAAMLDAFAADAGLSSGWQEAMETTSADEVRVPASGKTITIRYHEQGQGVRVAEVNGKPVLWDIDLPLGLNGRLGQLVPSRLIVTSTGAVQLAADIPFVDGIESLWTNDSSGDTVSFRTLRSGEAVGRSRIRPLLRMLCDSSYICTYSSGCPSCGGCSTAYYYCDINPRGGGYPDDGSGSGSGTNRISEPTLHTAVDNAKGNAIGKLGSTQCQAMIRNNTNAAGISLWDVMTSYSADPGTYIDSQITWVKGDGAIDIGSGLVPCNYGRLAWTAKPGVHTVDICGSFSGLSTGEGGVTLIHEMLHTLGLPEDPPDYTSEQIQQMVRDWCGVQ
jgi:hypothetical protein